MRHPARPAFLSGLLRRTRFDYRKEVGDGLDSSVVTAPIRWVQRALPEARLTCASARRRQRRGVPEPRLLALIQRPNPFYGDLVLWAATILSWYVAGNAYWIKVRNGVGRPAELWWVPWWMIEPKAPDDGSEFLSHYLYKPGGGDPADPPRDRGRRPFPRRHGPAQHALGLSSLDGVIREIFMDLESSNFVASLLRNMGVPGVVISPKGGAMPAPEDVEATKTWFQEAFGGDRRGGPLVMGAPTDVTPYGFNPQQMNMSEARDVAEERVCACIGIPAASSASAPACRPPRSARRWRSCSRPPGATACCRWRARSPTSSSDRCCPTSANPPGSRSAGTRRRARRSRRTRTSASSADQGADRRRDHPLHLQDRSSVSRRRRQPTAST
jgi:hypothetical protein